MRHSTARIEKDGKVYEKVFLPGESLWVEVVEGPTMGSMTGRIANDPACASLHDFKAGDVVHFGWVAREFEGEKIGAWEPLKTWGTS